MTEQQGLDIIALLTRLVQVAESMIEGIYIIALCAGFTIGILLVFMMLKASRSRMICISLLAWLPAHQVYAQQQPPQLPDRLQGGEGYCITHEEATYRVTRYAWHITYDDVDGYDVATGNAPEVGNGEFCECNCPDPGPGSPQVADCQTQETAVYEYIDSSLDLCQELTVATFHLVGDPQDHRCQLAGWNATINIHPSLPEPVTPDQGWAQCRTGSESPITSVFFSGLDYFVTVGFPGKQSILVETGSAVGFKAQDGTDCEACIPIGACLLTDGCEIQQCEDLNYYECKDQHPTAMWIKDTTCGDYGACILDDDTCTILTFSDCVAQTGSLSAFNSGTDCTSFPDNPCGTVVNPNDIDGDGIPNDQDLDIDGDGIPNDLDDDIDGDGIPNDQDDDDDGDGIPDIEDDTPDGPGDDPDPDPTGACCYTDGCDVVTEDECASVGGTWFPNQDCTACDPDTVGACCTEDDCIEEMTQSQCVAINGTWYEGQNCDVCIEYDAPIGACCFDGEICDTLTADVCATQGGIWIGPVPCINCSDPDFFTPWSDGNPFDQPIRDWIDGWGLPTEFGSNEFTTDFSLADGAINGAISLNPANQLVDLTFIRVIFRTICYLLLTYKFIMFIIGTLTR